ncbi:MAG TPA: XRE family transcriptional regulator [Bryobacteraceae bacterium]|nr:XRE family transcriptional regulator [Bryobacteraceae bacterium]
MRHDFHGLESRIVSLVRGKVQDGQFTERGLARKLGISQPHIHNVLCGRRRVTPDLLDIVLSGFHLTVLDLFTAEELRRHVQLRARTPAD